MGLTALVLPEQALWAVVFCIPLAPLQVDLRVGSFSLVELTVLIACVARVWQIPD